MSDPVVERSDPSITRQITRMNDGRWALIMGNGYHSSSEKAVLLIQYLDQGKELLKITADNTGNNGTACLRRASSTSTATRCRMSPMRVTCVATSGSST